jgi:hypothetical protein
MIAFLNPLVMPFQSCVPCQLPDKIPPLRSERPYPLPMDVVAIRLPPELFVLIGRHADDVSLHTLRLVSRLIYELITPLAFRTLLLRLGNSRRRSRIARLVHEAECLTLPNAPRQGFEHVIRHLRVCRLEMGDSTAYVGALAILSTDLGYLIMDILLADPSCVVDDLRSLKAVALPWRLEIVLSAPPHAHIGVFYAFSALLNSVSERFPALPFEEVEVVDLSRPDVQMTRTGTSHELRVGSTCSPVNQEDCIHIPKWVYLCPMSLTSLTMNHAVLNNDSMRGLYRVIPTLRKMELEDCLIDLSADAGQSLRWGFLWERAVDAGDTLNSVKIDRCSYGQRARGSKSLICPAAETVGLSLMLKEDIRLKKQLEDFLHDRLNSAFTPCCLLSKFDKVYD